MAPIAETGDKKKLIYMYMYLATLLVWSSVRLASDIIASVIFLESFALNLGFLIGLVCMVEFR